MCHQYTVLYYTLRSGNGNICYQYTLRCYMCHVLYFTTHCAALPLIRRMASSAAATVTRTVKIWAVGTLRTLVSAPPAHNQKNAIKMGGCNFCVSPPPAQKKIRKIKCYQERGGCFCVRNSRTHTHTTTTTHMHTAASGVCVCVM
jgi:hypothetical protein